MRRTTSSSCTATAACHSARICSAISGGSSGIASSVRPARTTSASIALSVRDSVAGSPPPRRARSLRTDTARRKRAAVGGAASPASVSMASTVARICSGVVARRGMAASERDFQAILRTLLTLGKPFIFGLCHVKPDKSYYLAETAHHAFRGLACPRAGTGQRSQTRGKGPVSK
ncbi:exported hypothetical protein [Cupriavidus taiwanensis]|nr:exported hypothetical protein [Cupriavidus taiwanensis]